MQIFCLDNKKKNSTIYGEDVFNGRFIAFPIPVVGSSLTVGPDTNRRHHVFPPMEMSPSVFPAWRLQTWISILNPDVSLGTCEINRFEPGQIDNSHLISKTISDWYSVYSVVPHPLLSPPFPSLSPPLYWITCTPTCSDHNVSLIKRDAISAEFASRCCWRPPPRGQSVNIDSVSIQS